MNLQVIAYRSCFFLVGFAAKLAVILVLVPPALANEVKAADTPPTINTAIPATPVGKALPPVVPPATPVGQALPAVAPPTPPPEVLPATVPATPSEVPTPAVETTTAGSPAPETAAGTTPQTATTTDVPVISEADGIPVITEAEFPTPIEGGIRFISPTPGTVLDTPATSVTAQFPEGTKLELRANGKLVRNDLIGRTEIKEDSTGARFVTQTWYGVPLQGGPNKLELFTSANGIIPAAEASATTTVQVRGEPKKLVLETVEAHIPADGRTTATVRGKLLDEDGNRSNFNAIVTLSANAGTFVGKDGNPDQDGFQVKVINGEFTAQLQAGLEAKTVRIRATTYQLETFTQLEFETNLRPTILTGVVNFRLGARGTDYFGRFEDFLPPEGGNQTKFDVTAKGFGEGRVGNWSLIAAYNSARSLNDDCSGRSRLGGGVEDTSACDRYPVYGDSSTVDRVVQSQDSLYLRLERNKNYFLWGDYGTEEFATASQLYTSTSRSLHGFKGNYHFGNLQVTGLYANSVDGFQRDTLAPDGTSGFYFLSRRLLVPGSQNIYIEQEELNRPGTVIRRTALIEGQDYDIDYDRGTLLFKRPIQRTDINLDGVTLVNKIIATYQYESRDGSTSLYGGRLRYQLSNKADQESWIGATYLREQQGSRAFQLYGGDFTYSLGQHGRFTAEYAYSQNDSDTLGLVDGAAYRVEYEGNLTAKLANKTYYRHTDTGFTNNATTSFVPGQTRYGTEFAATITPKTSLKFKFDHEDNHGIAPQVQTEFGDLLTPRTDPVPGVPVDNSLTTIDALVQQKIGKATVDVGIVHRRREDRQPQSPFQGNSTQFTSRVRIPLKDKLSFLGQYEQTLTGGQDPVYPSRAGVGLEWKANDTTRIALTQQFTFGGGQYSGRSITSLDIKNDYKLDQDTTVTSRYTIQGGLNGFSTQRSLGINNKLVIAPGLRLSFGYERIEGDLLGYTGAGLQFAQPFAPGSGGSSVGVNGGESYSAGLEYTSNPNFKASGRIERRSATNSGTNTVITAALAGKLTPSLTALMDYRQAGSANQTIVNLGTTRTLKLGLAYRNPENDKFNALLRYEFRQNPATIPDTLLIGSGTGSEDHTLAIETIYAPNWRWELYGKAALRYSKSYFANDFVNSSLVSLGQLRATYRVNRSIDVAADLRFINQTNPGYFETGINLEAGYYLTPNLRLAAGYAFGSASDRDFNGGRTNSGPYLNFTIKLDQLFQGFGIQRLINPNKEKQKTQPANVGEANKTQPQTQAQLP